MYKKMYFFLFNRITDAIEKLRDGQNGDALRTLIKTQAEAEQKYMEYAEKDE